LPDGKSEHVEWEDGGTGIGVRIRKGGSRKWIGFARINGKQRKPTFGDVNKIDLDAVRKIAKKFYAQVGLGIDPRAAKDKARADATRPTLETTVSRYLEFKEPVLRPATYEAAQNYFAVHWKPLLDRPIETIRRLDVAARLKSSSRSTDGRRRREHGPISAPCSPGACARA
jgi:hypothetical protein